MPDSKSHKPSEPTFSTVDKVFSPGLAYSLAYEPAKAVAVDQVRALLARLSKDPIVATDRALAHAVAFAEQATLIKRKIALKPIQSLMQRATDLGFQVPDPPEDSLGWLHWRSVVESLIAANVDEHGALALSLGGYGFELLRAWSFAANLAFLRASSADHPILLKEANQIGSDVSAAWRTFERAIRAAGRPLLDLRLVDLAWWIDRAPRADGSESGSSNKIYNFIESFNRIAEGFSKDLDAPNDPPPSSPPTPEEETLFAAIIANPDDDDLRLRFAKLAALRGDPRAEFIVDQFEQLIKRGGRANERARQRIGSHPEWIAPFLALGARDVKFEKGFVSEIEIDVDSFATNAKELFALAPITVVRIRGGLAGQGAKLASVSQLAQVHVLDLGKQGVTDADVIALVRSGNLGKLWELRLSENPITAVGVDAIAAATHAMPELTCVNLQITGVDPSDTIVYYNEEQTQGDYVPTAEGKALEAKYGPLPWLHARQTVLGIPVPRQRT